MIIRFFIYGLFALELSFGMFFGPWQNSLIVYLGIGVGVALFYLLKYRSTFKEFIHSVINWPYVITAY